MQMTGGRLAAWLNVIRRFIASALLCAFSGLSISPVIFSDPQSNLPACCRRDGKHHCSIMQMGERSTDGRDFTASARKCPLFPQVVPVAQRIQLYPVTTETCCGYPIQESAVPAQVETPHRSSPVRVQRERGPPQLTFLG